LITILFTFAALKFPKQNRLKVFKKVIKMINLKILESAVLLNLINHKMWRKILLSCASFVKHVGLFIQIPSPHLLLTRKTVIEKSPFFVLKKPRG